MIRTRELSTHIECDADTEDRILDEIAALLLDKFPEAWPAGVIATRPVELEAA